MKIENLKKLTLSAVFAAIVFVATYIIRIPTPANGYVNLGDGFVLFSGWVLGPWYGAMASGIGSMFADLFSGYTVYAPITFFAKFSVALVAWLIFKYSKKNFFGLLLSSVVGESIMVVSYFLFSWLFYGDRNAALVSAVGDLGQAVVGIVFGIVLYSIGKKTRLNNMIGDIDNGKHI